MSAALPAPVRLPLSLAISLGLHAFLLFGITLSLPDKHKISNLLQPLEVMLVNTASRERPQHADALAQANLDGGGGNAPTPQRPQSPLPEENAVAHPVDEQAAQRAQQLEQEQKRLLTQLKSQAKTPQENTRKWQMVSGIGSADQMQRNMEIARLEAQVDQNFNDMQKSSRRKHFGATAKEFRFARYMEDWRMKVEQIGNLNYPEEARRQKIYGRLQLTVTIRSDGSVENIEVTRRSGYPILDAAAMRIVKLAAPYAAFPPNIAHDTDTISITRTWTFTSSDKLESE
ncbi:MAG: energy transducer TonB [Pseudomonadota bacterium]